MEERKLHFSQPLFYPVTQLASAPLLSVRQILVNSLCRSLACAHGENHRGRSRNGIASGVNALLAGFPEFLVRNDAFPLIDLKAFCGG